MRCCIILILIVLNLSTIANPFASTGILEDAVTKLTNDLVAKYNNKSKNRIAILQFRTANDQVSRINQLIQNKMNATLTSSSNCQTIEQFSINHLVDELGWNLNNSCSFKVYSSLNEKIFESTGVIADAFIYGIIKIEGENLIIQAFLIPDGVASNAIKAMVQVSLNDVPNTLLDDQQ